MTRMINNIPTYDIDMAMSQWNPLREQISIIINGIGRDLSLVIDGLDTSKPMMFLQMQCFHPR